ncbi:MAG: hypothetical protein DLM53_11695 [Candidatus Eremiobacter antarcticus]|nr:MAG: hypothetical protein DLM53_11695 [Candidatus Eremiobacter sp. RRmetagenome_bin22]
MAAYNGGMNKFMPAMLAIAFSLAPFAARADAPSLDQGQGRQQMRQLRQQAQAEALNALTPAHRTLVTQVVGQLETQQRPDMHNAARTLDAALTPSERQSVLSIASRYEGQIRQMRQKGGVQAAGPQGQLPKDGSQGAGARNAMRSDAGYNLLRLSMGHRWHHGSAGTSS